jgi:hypothetical protein
VWTGCPVASGDDLYSGAFPHTHGQVAVTAAESLADGAGAALPHQLRDRLGQWAADQPGDDDDPDDDDGSEVAP